MNNSRKPRAARLAPVACVLSCLTLAFFFHAPASAQQPQQERGVPPPPPLTRTTTRHEVKRFAYGSGLTIVGAPAGSITIESWPKSEIDITADIELRANTEEELALLAAVNGFIIDDDANHIRILTTGTHDKVFMRRAAKKFPKALLNLPWKIDYRIRVPAICDLEIDAGRGPFKLTGVEGSISFKALETDAVLELTGGAVMATVGGGSVNIIVRARSWRGAGAIVQLARGDLTVELPPGFNADITADVLRAGQIENTYDGIVPQERTTFTPRSVHGRAGSGGAALSFKVTDGTLRIKQGQK